MPQPSAIITGAGRGIGRATAVELAHSGYRLALLSRSPDELNETARLCGGSALPIPTNVCDAAAIHAAVERAVQEFGRVDALVHNAGLANIGPLENLPPEQWQAVIDTNLSAAYHFCRALWPLWRAQGGGAAVFVSSQAARDPFVGLAAYSAAKAGLNALGLALAREGAPIGIRVHTIAPGAVETVMLRGVVSHQQYPTEKTLAPEDVARVLAQCVRGELRHASGEVIYIHKTV